MKIHRIFIPITFLAFLFAFSIKPAQAHAYLATSSPEFNAALDKTPSLVELVFTEAIEANFSKVEVLDLEGNRVDNDDSTVDPANPTRMTVTVRSLVDGIYTVSWKTLSLVDSHITAGAFPFSVGDVDPEAMAAAARASTQTTLSFGEVIFRWLSYLSSSAFIGGVLFVMTVWQPAYQAVNDKIEKTPPLSPPWRKLAVFSLFLLVAANILGLLSQTGQLVDQEIAAPWNPAINRLLFGTKYGMFWMVRFVMALIIARFLLNAKTKRDWWISFAATLVILVTFSFNSHAAAEPQWVLPISADWVHLVGASAWIGGLIYFIGGLWTIRETDPSYRTRLTAALIPRFSALAAVSVGIIGLTGIYSAYLRIGTYENLIGTLYGKVLIVKILLALPMFLLGATNLLRTSPGMRKAE
ncbi:MAG: copper resistance CopC/CopD family protein, partial [Anaerolineales bacterium]